MPAYRLLCLDFDGTIMDSMPAFVHSMRGAAIRHGVVPPPEDRIALSMGQGSLAKCIRFLFPDLPETAVPDWVTAYREIYRDEGADLASPYPGVRQTLTALQRAGLRLAVTSNKGEPLLRSGLQDARLLDFFEIVVGELPGQPKKPDAAMYHRRVGPFFPETPAEAVLVVGDAETDMAFARELGMPACLALYGYGQMEHCLAYAPRHATQRFSQLLEHVGA